LSFRHAQKHLDKTPLSGRADRDFIESGLRAATTGRRATHLPLFDMQTVGCAANRPFASETHDKYDAAGSGADLRSATDLAANLE
jgi:hypothetical protein